MQGHAGKGEGCDSRLAEIQGTIGLRFERELGSEGADVGARRRQDHSQDSDRVTARKIGALYS